MAINLNDKTNKSIAALASKIMQEQPTKVREFTDTKPIESDMVQRVMNTGLKGNFIKEEAKQYKQIDEELDRHVDDYAKHTLNAHTADDLHVGNDHRQMAHQTLKHIEKNYGPVGVRWAQARAGEHIDNHNKAEREAEKASIMKRYKPTPAGAKVYQYPKSEVKEDAEQIDELSGRGGGILDRYRNAVRDRHGKTHHSDNSYTLHANPGPNPREKGYILATKKLVQGPGYKEYVKGSEEHNTNYARKPVNVIATNSFARNDKQSYPRNRNEEVEQIDETDYTHRVWFRPKDGKGSHFGVPAHSDDYSRAHKELHNYVGKKVATQYEPYKVEPYKTNEDVEQVDEGRFGKAIDPSKLSPEARARIAARDAAKKPVEAKPGTKLGDIAASFKKPEPKKEEPKEEPKPAAKTGNKFTQLRQQNMERMKQHQAAVAAGKVGGGSGQRSGGNTGENPDARDKESDLVKSSHEIAGEKAAAHGGTKGAIVSGSLKPDKTANKKKPGEDEHDDDVHEALKGNQHKIDANHNGRIDGQDFKLLRAKHKKGK